MKLSKPVFIGIAGGTASGKSSIADILRENFKQSNSVTIIKEDDYYKYQPNTTYEERCKTNYDHPLAFDFDLMTENIKQLMNGESIVKPTYDYTIHNRSEITENVDPSDVIILEGLFALYHPDIREMEDIKIFVDSDADERILRRILRDVEQRGRDLNGVITQYLTTVKPMHNIYVEPTRYMADIVINSGFNDVAFDVIKNKIDQLLEND